MDKRKIILIFAFSIIEFSCALPKNDVHLDFCDFEKPNYDYISDLVSFKIQTVQCENDEIKSFTTPEKPDGYNLNKLWHLKQINETDKHTKIYMKFISDNLCKVRNCLARCEIVYKFLK